MSISGIRGGITFDGCEKTTWDNYPDVAEVLNMLLDILLSCLISYLVNGKIFWFLIVVCVFVYLFIRTFASSYLLLRYRKHVCGKSMKGRWLSKGLPYTFLLNSNVFSGQPVRVCNWPKHLMFLFRFANWVWFGVTNFKSIEVDDERLTTWSHTKYQ